MIEFNSNGDMFESGCDILVNATNCVGVMGGGLARAFADRFPAMNQDYIRACRLGLHRPGLHHIWTGEDGFTILNFATKDDWHFDSEYSFVGQGLESLSEFLDMNPSLSIAIPKLGCGLGRLKWEVVRPMIQSYLKDCGNHIVLFGPEQ